LLQLVVLLLLAGLVQVVRLLVIGHELQLLRLGVLLLRSFWSLLLH
jgi:hypothetical protein